MINKINLARMVLVSVAVLLGAGCKDTGSASIRFYQEDLGAEYMLSADPFTLESAFITLHDATDPVCDDTKGNCIRVNIEGDYSVDVSGIPVGEWYIWTGGFADHKSWTGASCSFEVTKGVNTEHNIVLQPGVGTSICNRVEQGVEVEFKTMAGEDFPLFNNGIVNLHKSDNAVCNDALNNCVQVSMDGHPGVIIPDVEPTNWYIWAGGVAGYQAYAGYPCRFDVPVDAVTYQEVRLSEGTGTRVCTD